MTNVHYLVNGHGYVYEQLWTEFENLRWLLHELGGYTPPHAVGGCACICWMYDIDVKYFEKRTDRLMQFIRKMMHNNMSDADAYEAECAELVHHNILMIHQVHEWVSYIQSTEARVPQ